PYALGALAHAKRLCPATLTALICCTQDPPASQADHVIALATGPEILTGSTRLKAGTATKLTLNTISTTLMVRLGKTYQNLMVDVRATNTKLRDRAARIISTLTPLSRPDAFALLDRAGGSVKTAVVMQRRGMSREQAEKLLATCGGRLEKAIGESGETSDI
nr:N-acetylmuramic acid 6-phosphate etherase [Planctomycetota bacterium]